MKIFFKRPFFVMAIVASLIACKGNRSGSSSDSSKTDSSKTGSSGLKQSDTSHKSDSAKKTTDTIVKADDTSKARLDTVSKTIKETKVVKKVVIKNKK